MTVNERISFIIKELHLNNNSFAKAINVNPTVTFNIISGRCTKPSYELLEKILFTFDNISAEWILREEGHWFRDKNNPGRLRPIDATEKTEITSQLDAASPKIYDENTPLINSYKENLETLKEQLNIVNKTNAVLLELLSKK